MAYFRGVHWLSTTRMG